MSGYRLLAHACRPAVVKNRPCESPHDVLIIIDFQGVLHTIPVLVVPLPDVTPTYFLTRLIAVFALFFFIVSCLLSCTPLTKYCIGRVDLFESVVFSCRQTQPGGQAQTAINTRSS